MPTGTNASIQRALSTPITDIELEQVYEEFGLTDVDQNRKNFLRDLGSIDVSASPGSGKTTLILAKLRILTQRWGTSSRGICLLSHTNVAKKEISERFEKFGTSLNDSGQPHFVGTIHAFLNKYLATPYLLSQGIVPQVIDDDISKAVFASRIRKHKNYPSLNWALQKRSSTNIGDISLKSADLKQPFKEKLLTIGGPKSASYICAAETMASCIEDGYLRPDDILIFAEKYLELHPWVATALRYRFPAVFVDEMQDTSQTQNNILNRIFPPNMESGIIQRIGDPNQTIFNPTEDARDSGTPTSFPSSTAITISNSRRISQNIADVANPLAVTPIEPRGLQGIDRSNEIPGTGLYIITFEGPHDIDRVLPTFTEITKKIMTPEQIDGKDIYAIGYTHKERIDDTPKPEHFPRTVGEYHTPYQAGQLVRPQLPVNLRHALYAARETVSQNLRVSEGLDIVLASIFRALGESSLQLQSHSPYGKIAALSEAAGVPPNILRHHLLRVLGGHEESLEPSILELISHLSRISTTSNTEAWSSFLESKQLPESIRANRSTSPVVDPLEDIHESNSIPVKIGSIPSVKGETHAATLILDTFFKARHLPKLLPWLVGRRENFDHQDNNADRVRLTTCFVAMTRPTHVLALAMSSKELGKTSSESQKNRSELIERGWNIVSVKS